MATNDVIPHDPRAKIFWHLCYFLPISRYESETTKSLLVTRLCTQDTPTKVVGLKPSLLITLVLRGLTCLTRWAIQIFILV